jgi:hypothetical protein
LLLQRLPQFVEQPRVLDGDDDTAAALQWVAADTAGKRRFRATMWAKVPQTKAGIADFNRRYRLGEPRPGDSRPGLVGPSGIKGFVPMTTVPSVAIATVAALLVYSFGRAIRSPLRRWRRRSSSQPSSRGDGLDAPVRLRRFKRHP